MAHQTGEFSITGFEPVGRPGAERFPLPIERRASSAVEGAPRPALTFEVFTESDRLRSPLDDEHDDEVDDDAEGLRAKTMRGGAAMVVATLVMRGSSLIAQLILGRLLLPEQFGVYAIALSFVTLATALRSVLRPYLVDTLRVGGDLDALYRRTMWSVVALVGVALVATPAVARRFDGDHLGLLLALMFLSVPFQVQPVFGLARMNHDMSFGRLGRVLALGIVFRQVATVVGALAGWGVVAFAVGTFVGSFYEIWAVRSMVGRAPSLFGWMGGTLPSLRWLPLGVVALTLWVNGDYAVAGWFESAAVVGIYYFGFQLTGGLTQPFTMAAGSVLVPAFGRLEDEERLRSSYLETLRALPLLAGLPFGLLAVCAAPVLHWVWAGRWDDAAVVVVFLAAALPVRLAHSVVLSIVQARGMWRIYSILVSLSAVVTAVGAAVGAIVGGPVGLAAVMSVMQLVTAVAVAVWVGRRFGVGGAATLGALLPPWLVWLAGIGLASLCAPVLTLGLAPLLTRVSVFTLATVPVVFIAFRDEFSVVATLARRRG